MGAQQQEQDLQARLVQPSWAEVWDSCYTKKAIRARSLCVRTPDK